MICIDASLATKWVFPEDYSDRALALLAPALASESSPHRSCPLK